MATEYSLLTWAGLGTTVTFTDAGDIVNMTAHGAPNGHAFRFTTTGTLPPNLVANTTYYLRQGADANKFIIHPTQADAIAGTNQVTFTGTGSGTHKVVGEYWAALDASGRARYGTSPNERVYATYALAVTAINAATSDYSKSVTLEFEGRWDDVGNTTSISNKWYSIVLTSRINWVRGTAYHNRLRSGGYRKISTTQYTVPVLSANPRTIIDGLEIISTYNSADQYACGVSGANSIIINNIFQGYHGFKSLAVGQLVFNNIAVSCFNTGFVLFQSFSSDPGFFAFNLSVKNLTGFQGTNANASCVGNISIGNTTNWGTAPTSCYLAYNGGLVSESWDNSTTRFTIATTDFVNYANDDFRPALVTSPQVELITLTDGDGLPRYDITDSVRPNYEASSFPNNKATAGPFEFDHGEGLAPLAVPITISNITSGSVLAIYKTSDGSVILAPTTVSGTSYSNPSFSYVGDTAVTIVITNAAYVRYSVPNNITTAGMSQIAGQEADTVRLGSYPAGIATEWTITDGVSFEHTSGSTIYTGQQLYSRLCDYFDQSSKHLVPLVISAETHYDFTLKAPYTITDVSHQWIKTCSITESAGDTLWSNAKLVTTGLASGTDIYAIQDGSKITSWWATGTLDVLIKVKSGGALIDSGLVKFFAREYGKLYGHFLADLSGGGSNPIPLSTDVDSNNITTIGTIAALSGISLTVGATTWDVGDGAGAQPYTAILNCNNHSLADVYEYTKWLTRRTSTTSINGIQGEQYTHLGSFPDVVSAPLGTFAGGKFFPAIGIKLTNINAADVLHFQATDNNGVTHAPPVPPVSLTITNMVVGSRLQLYDLTTSTELFNGVVAASSQSVTYTYPGSDHDIRYRVAYTNGVTAKAWVEDQGVATSTGMNIRVNQQPDAVYNAIAVDGSTVTECSISGGTLVINIDDPDNTTTAQRLYSFECYWLTTVGGIRDQNLYIQATDITHYVYEGGLKIKNSKANPLQITGANIVPVSGPATDVFDNTGGSIFLNFNRVEGFSYSIGSGLSTAEHNQLMALYPGLTTAQETKLNSKLSTGTFIALT